MNIEGLFVGGVAMALGAAGVIISIGNWDTCYRSSKVRWVESIGGRMAARWTYAVVGILLVILGIAIARGFAPNATDSQARSPTPAGMQDATQQARLFSQPGSFDLSCDASPA